MSSPVAAPEPAAASRMMLLVLVAVSAAPQASLQIFLPALPAIQADFAVPHGVAQLTLSLSILAGAVATLAYGPLSDTYGRRPMLLAGMLIFAISSLAAALAPGIGSLIGARILQAMGASSGIVLARAVVRDLYDRERAASVIAYLSIAMVIAPMVSPTLGALLTDGIGWRAIFWTVGAAAALLTWLCYRHLAETLPPRRDDVAVPGLLAGAGILLRIPAFLAYMLQSALAIATFFAFLAGAPYFMVDVLGRTATEYGLWFIAISACFMLGNFVSARLVRRVGMHRLIHAGSVIVLGSALLEYALFAAGYWNPAVLFVPCALIGFGNGLTIANAMAGAVSVEPRLAGTASGLCAFTQMLIAAVVSQVVGMLQDGTPYAMAGGMVLCALLSLLAIRLLRTGREVAA